MPTKKKYMDTVSQSLKSANEKGFFLFFGMVLNDRRKTKNEYEKFSFQYLENKKMLALTSVKITYKDFEMCSFSLYINRYKDKQQYHIFQTFDVQSIYEVVTWCPTSIYFYYYYYCLILMDRKLCFELLQEY